MLALQKIKSIALLVVILFCIILYGCAGDRGGLPVEPDGQPGRMLLKFSRTDMPANVAIITASLTRSGFTPVTQAMNVLTDTSADLQINNLAAGLWHLKIEAKNNLAKVIYSGETDITIEAAAVIQVCLTLQPTADNVGGLYIYVTWVEPVQYKNWCLQSSCTNADLHSVYFCDAALGWAVGDNGVIIKTTDSGINWKKQNSGVSDKLNSVYFLDINVGWAVGDNGTILKTTNGGLSWYALPKVTQNSLYSVKFVNTIIGLITGENGTVIYAHNEFDYLDLKNIGSQEKLTSAFYIRGKAGWIISTVGSIYKSTDNGKNWIKSSSSSPSWSLNSIAFGDTSIGIAVGNGGIIARTTNGGTVWKSLYPAGSTNLFGVHFINSTTGWIAAEKGKILKTTNSGMDWNFEGTETAFDIESISFADAVSGWAVGKNGVVLKYKP